jgi:hypothetical protein
VIIWSSVILISFSSTSVVRHCCVAWILSSSLLFLGFALENSSRSLTRLFASALLIRFMSLYRHFFSQILKLPFIAATTNLFTQIFMILWGSWLRRSLSFKYMTWFKDPPDDTGIICYTTSILFPWWSSFRYGVSILIGFRICYMLLFLLLPMYPLCHYFHFRKFRPKDFDSNKM